MKEYSREMKKVFTAFLDPEEIKVERRIILEGESW